MQKLFILNQQTRELEINMPEALLVKEFADLVKEDNSADKERFFRQLAYIVLVHAWDSPYSQYDEETRKEESRRDTSLKEKECEEKTMIAAERKFVEIQASNKSVRLLEAAREAADKFIDYFENIVDLSERDKGGKPVFTAEKVMREMTLLNKVHQELTDLENRVKKELAETSQIRAGAIEGYEDYED